MSYLVSSARGIFSRIINAFGKERLIFSSSIRASSWVVQFPAVTLKYGFSYVMYVGWLGIFTARVSRAARASVRALWELLIKIIIL